MKNLIFVISLFVLMVISCNTPISPAPDKIHTAVGYEKGTYDGGFFIRNTKIFVNETQKTVLRCFWWPVNGEILYSDSLLLKYTYLNEKLVLYNGEVSEVFVDTSDTDFLYQFSIKDGGRTLTGWVLRDPIF